MWYRCSSIRLKHLPDKTKYYIIVSLVIVVLSFLAGYTIAQNTPVRNIYLENLPSTTTCIIETDGNGTYWATNSSGKVISISDSARTVYDACKTLITSNGGGEILFRKGVYVFPITLVLANNMVIRGEDSRNTVIMLEENSGYTNIISGIGVENITISNIVIRLSSSQASTGIHLSESIYNNPKNIRIENVYFYGGSPNETGEIGVYLRSVENIIISKSYFVGLQNAVKCYSCSRVSLADNAFNDISGTVLTVDRNSYDISFTGNNVKTLCTNTTTCSYIYISESNTLRFIGNSFSANPLNYLNHEEWFNINNSANIDLESNHFQLASYNALSTVVANISKTSDVFIANNRVEGGPIIYAGDECNGVTVTNNMVSSQNLYATGSNLTAMLPPSDDDKNYLYDYQGPVYLENKPLTATCVIETDGSGKYWALTSHGKIIESTNAKTVYDKCREIIVNEGGGKIFFRRGTYVFPDTILLADHMVLQGEGMDNTILRLDANSGSINVIAGVDVIGVTISNLRIDLRTNTRTTGILIHGFTTRSAYIRIHDIVVRTIGEAPAGSKGVYLNNVGRAYIRDSEFLGRYLTPIYCNGSYRILIENNYLLGGSYSPNAIVIENSNLVAIKDNEIYYYTAEASPYNSTLYVEDSAYIEITGNKFSEVYNGILYAGTSSDVHFDGNEAYMYCNSQTDTCSNMIVFYYSDHSSVTGNTFKGFVSQANPKSFTWVTTLGANFIYISSNDIFSSGSRLLSISQSNYVTINSNNMYTTNIDPSLSAIYLGDVNDVRVLDNVIRAPGTDAFYLTCTRNNVVISNNVIIADNLLTPTSSGSCLLSPSDSDLNYLRSTP